VELLTEPSSLKTLKLHFFDLEVIIRSDSCEFLNLFSAMYRRFRCDELMHLTKSKTEYSLITSTDNIWGKPVLISNGKIWPLNDPKLLDGFAYESILIDIITNIHSHLLIHSGVVSFDNKGILIVADSGHGKTTLVLELLNRGFKFLSDEMAALGRKDHLVYPFPRSLRIRNETTNLVKFPAFPASRKTWLGKLILDIDEIFPNKIGTEAPLHYIIFLHNNYNDGSYEFMKSNSKKEISIFVDQINEDILNDISNIKNVENVRTYTSNIFPIIQLQTLSAHLAISQIELLCSEHNILVLDVKKETERTPSFNSPVQLNSINKEPAVFELLKGYQGGYKSKVLQDEFKGSGIHLFMELSSIVKNTSCFRLSSGPLDEMADLVCNLIDVK